MATSMPAAAPRAKGVERREDGVGGRRGYRFTGAEMRVRFSTPGGLSSEQKNGRAHKGARPFGEKNVSGSLPLELEAHAELNLTLAEERAVRAGDGVEAAGAAVEGQSRTGYGVERLVDCGDLRAVEEVEALGQHLDVRALCDLEAAREARIEVPDFRLLEEVARDEREARRAARAVDAAARRRVRGEAEGRGTYGAGDVPAEALPGEGVKNRGERPAVEDRAARLVGLQAGEGGVVVVPRPEFMAGVARLQRRLP